MHNKCKALLLNTITFVLHVCVDVVASWVLWEVDPDMECGMKAVR